MSKPISNVEISAPNNSQGQSGREQNNSNAGIDSLPSLVLARIFEFAAADQEGFETTGAIRSTSREFRRAKDEVLLPDLYYNTKTALRNHPFFQSLPEFQRIINANSDHLKSVQLFKDLSRAIHAPCLLFPEQYVRAHEQLEDHSLVTVWERIARSINFENDPIPRDPQAIREWISNPDNNHRIQAITELDLSSMNLECLPKEIGAFVNLHELNLSNNRLRWLPESLGNLENLENLDLQYNQLASLPESFGNLQQLRELILDNNHLSSLPESFGNLRQLQRLYLSHNHLRSLPDSFVNLENLKNLDLQFNQLASLPEAFGNLLQLQDLNLSDNQLESLPESFGNLGQLKSLYLSNNQLASLPGSFGNLRRLKWVYLQRNQLTSLPESFRNLPDRIILNLEGNLCMFVLNKKFSEFVSRAPIRTFEKYKACQQCTPRTSLAKLCQLIHNQADKNLLEPVLRSIPLEIQVKIQTKIEDIWVSLPEHQEVENIQLHTPNAVSAACHERVEVLNQAIIEVLKETFSSFTEEQKRLVYDQVWDLAGRPDGDSNWGEIHAEDNIIRLIDAMALVCEEGISSSS